MGRIDKVKSLGSEVVFMFIIFIDFWNIFVIWYYYFYLIREEI